MGAATIQTFDQVPSSSRGACRGEGRGLIPLQSSSLPRTLSKLAKHCVDRGSDRHRLFGDRFVSHDRTIAQR